MEKKVNHLNFLMSYDQVPSSPLNLRSFGRNLIAMHYQEFSKSTSILVLKNTKKKIKRFPKDDNYTKSIEVIRFIILKKKHTQNHFHEYEK